jgi:hypothetical protein
MAQGAVPGKTQKQKKIKTHQKSKRFNQIVTNIQYC